MKSIEIFKQIISNYIPEYKSSLDEAVFRDAKSFFTDSDSEIGDTRNISRANNTVSYIFEADSEIIEPTLKQQLKNKEIDLNEIIDEFLGDLAQLYLKESNSTDPIILFLLSSNNPEFLEQLEFAKELKLAFQRIDRQEKKVQLKQIDVQEDEKIIRAAFQRIERAEKKKQLQELENEHQLNKPAASKNQIPWKFVIRVAAVLILVLIPVGISVLFFGDDETTVGVGKGPKPKGGKTIIYAETGDLTELKEIELPNLNNVNFSTQIDKKYKTQGYSNSESKIAISIIFNGDQIAYLDKKITLLDSKIKELKNKNIKDKEATLTSLAEISKKCKSEKQILELKELTYEFDNKAFKLIIYSKNKIDPKKLKVYSIINDIGSFSYYLNYENKDYNLNEKKGSLKVAIGNTEFGPRSSILSNKTNIFHVYKDNFNYIFLKNDLKGVSFKIEISCDKNCNGDDFVYSTITDTSFIKIDHINQLNKITSRTFVIKVTTEFNGEYRTDIKKNVKFKC